MGFGPRFAFPGAKGGAKVDHGSGGTVPLRRSKTLPLWESFPVTGRVGGIHTVDLYRKVRLACRDEMSERAAARHLGVSRQSVRKMFQFSVSPGYRRTAPVRRPKLDEFTGLIEQWLEDDRRHGYRKQRHTAKRIFERLRDEHGFTGGYMIVNDYVSEHRRHRREMFVCCRSQYFVGDFSVYSWSTEARFVTLPVIVGELSGSGSLRGARRRDSDRDDHGGCGEDGLASAPAAGERGGRVIQNSTSS